METLNWMQYGPGWLSDGTMVALGWTLLHFCWQGAAIALLYAVADRLTLRAGARVRYGIAMLALTLMPLVALATFAEQQKLVVHVSGNGHDIAVSHVGAMHGAIMHDLPIAAPITENSELWIASHASRLLPWIDAVWLAGVLFLTLRAVGGWWQLERLRRHASVAVPVEVMDSFHRVVERLRMGRAVALRISDDVISPLAMGVWRSAIILPASAILLLPADQLEAVLAHELAHIRRWDYLCNLLQTTAECLLFFHPAVWWVSRCTRDLREVCCDEVAARSCEDPVIYAEALLQLEEQRSKNLRLAMALKGHNGNLLQRISQILGEGMTMERTMTSGVRAAAAGAVVLALFLGSRTASGLKPKPKTQAAVIAVEPRQAAPATTLHLSAALKPLAEPLPVASPESAAVLSDGEGHLLVASEPTPIANPSPTPMAAPSPSPSPVARNQSAEITTSGSEYLQKMRDAGYPLDLNKDLDQIVALRSLGVTPEYAKAMAQVGMGTPSLQELKSMKAVGVTPDYLAGLRASNIPPASFHEAISEKTIGVTPDYAKSIGALGIGTPTVHDLISLKAQGVTPEYVVEMKTAGLPMDDIHQLGSMKAVGVTPEYAKSIAAIGIGKPTLHDLISLKAQGITPEYAASMKASGMPVEDLHQLASMKALGVTPEYAKSLATAGFPIQNASELLALRAQGVTPEYARWIKQTFPTADMHGLRQGAVFHVDADFVARARAHGFTDTSLDKLVKLKMTGLLD